MSRPFWLRPLRLTEKSVVLTESVIRLAMRRESLEGLLRGSVASLIESTNADRAGIWAEEAPGDPMWQGQIAQTDSGGFSWERCKVNVFESFPVEFSDSNSPLEFFAPVFPIGPQAFFEGMSTAVGVPLKIDDQVLGALLIGATRPGKLASREVVENISAEIAIALFANRAREQHERTQQAFQLRDDVENRILAGAGVEEILSRITAAAVHRTQAQFVGVARRTDVGLRWEALSGSHLPAQSLRPALFTVATAVFLDRDSVVRDFQNGSSTGLSVVGLPIDCSNDESLLLLAGYRSGDRIPIDTLDEFRTMAANARFTATARETHAAYRSLFESSCEGLVVSDCAGRIFEANRRAREMLHWKSDLGSQIAVAEFLEQPSATEFQEWLARAASAARAPLLDARLESGLEVRIALRQVLAGSHRLLLALEEGYLAHRAESRWRRTQAELCSVLETVHAGILLVGIDRRIRLANSRFGLLFGLDAQAMSVPQTFEDLSKMIQPRFRCPSVYGAPWKAFLSGAGDPVHDKIEMAVPTGRVIERYARPVLDEEGRRLGWLEAYWDVTAQAQVQSKLQQTEKMAAIGQLVSGVAHELNNPLTSIMGYAQLLLGHPASGQAGEARLIFEEAERASRIVKNLLAYARRAEPARSRADLNQIVERTVALRDYELKIQNIAVRCDLDPDLPPTLADGHQLQQAILNLLINAEQASLSSQKQGHIQVRTHRVSESRYSIEISDDGPGIPREISARIFESYFTTKPSGVGTGLGLAIVRRIAEQHEGTVKFENLATGGAKFILEFPLLPVPTAEPTPAREREPEIVQKAASAHILVVEDEPSVAQLVADVLREDGHDVEAVIDSQEGLQRVARRRYDLIICDLRMPRLDGPAFYDALVRARSTARHRMLFITGDTLGPHTTEFLKSHQLQFLTKPFLVEELKLAVYRVLEHAAFAGLASAEAHG